MSVKRYQAKPDWRVPSEEPNRFLFRGKAWTLMRLNPGETGPPNRNGKGKLINKTDSGSCEAPYLVNRRMFVRRDKDQKKVLDTFIHEALHACFWDLAEEAVADAATSIAHMLHELGYRKPAEQEPVLEQEIPQETP